MTDNTLIKHFKKCILGGAIGDALGAPIEFKSTEQIRSEFGESGLAEYTQAYGHKGAITDDTQMTLFTIEGLILSKVRQEYQGDEGVVLANYHALLRWLYTQETDIQKNLINNHGTCSIVDGVLTGHRELFSVRAPTDTCLVSLKSGKLGTDIDPVNNEKTSGGIMRMAPVGLAFDDAEKAFYFGCRLAALTHGHPTGILPAGTLAALISLITSGESLPEAIESSSLILKSHKDHDETLRAVGAALDRVGNHPPEPKIIEEIGSGQEAHEALAVSLYCSLSADDNFQNAVVWAINHSGKSDTIGSITGNIMGTLLGVTNLPENWLDELELKELIKEMAGDLFDQFGQG